MMKAKKEFNPRMIKCRDCPEMVRALHLDHNYSWTDEFALCIDCYRHVVDSYDGKEAVA